MDLMRKLDILPTLSKIFKSGFIPKLSIPLKKAEMDTLLQIKFSEGKPMNYYSNKVNLENGSFTYLADKLEKKGFIKRVYIEKDRRKKVIILTDEGKDIINELIKQFEEHLSLKLTLLSAKDKEKLFSAVDVLEDIGKKLEN